MAVYNKGMLSDTLLGAVTIPVAAFISGTLLTEDYTLTYDGAPAGSIKLQCQLKHAGSRALKYFPAEAAKEKAAADAQKAAADAAKAKAEADASKAAADAAKAKAAADAAKIKAAADAKAKAEADASKAKAAADAAKIKAAADAKAKAEADASKAKAAADAAKAKAEAEKAKAAKNLPSHFSLVVKSTGMLLDAGTSTADGAPLIQLAGNGSLHQEWSFETKDEEGFGLLRARHSGKVLDVAGVSTADGGKLQMHTAHGGTNQLFRFEAVSGSWGVWRNKHSSKVLDVADKAPGAIIHQWTQHGAENQLWMLAPQKP